MNSTAYATYKQYLKETNDVGVAANLTLADANQTLADVMQRSLDAGAKPEPPANGMLNLKQAAAYLGYTAEGLRKIVERTRRQQSGLRVQGPTIEFSQAGKRGSLLFRCEWLDHFIEKNRNGRDTPLLPKPKPCKGPGRPPKPAPEQGAWGRLAVQ